MNWLKSIMAALLLGCLLTACNPFASNPVLGKWRIGSVEFEFTEKEFNVEGLINQVERYEANGDVITMHFKPQPSNGNYQPMPINIKVINKDTIALVSPEGRDLTLHRDDTRGE